MRSLKDLAEMREGRKSEGGPRLVIGMGTCGIAAGARETLLAVLDELGKRNQAHVRVTQTGCVGRCEEEPLLDVILPGQPKVTYGRVDPQRARQIIADHLIGGRIAGEWAIAGE